MKTQNYSKYLLTVLALTLSGAAFAQADSGSVPPLRGNPRVLPLSMQERETPVVNNTTVQQITQVVQPRTYQTAAGGGGLGNSAAYASCGGATLLSGGVTCDAGGQTTSVTYTQPMGNGWYGSCLTASGWVNTTAYAVCSN